MVIFELNCPYNNSNALVNLTDYYFNAKGVVVSKCAVNMFNCDVLNLVTLKFTSQPLQTKQTPSLYPFISTVTKKHKQKENNSQRYLVTTCFRIFIS